MDAIQREYACLNRKEDEYAKWLVKTLAPVILGVKPAELLSFPKDGLEVHMKLAKVKEIFSKCSRISYVEFEFQDRSTKILFYNSICLDNTLRDQRNLNFLHRIGYAKEYSLSNYIHVLLNKMRGGSIPDEIGVFLGYPLKDVLGFIGHPSLKLTQVKGWRVYGNIRISELRYKQFLEAKVKINCLLKDTPPEIILWSA